MIDKINWTRIGQHVLFWLIFLLYQLTSHTSKGNLIGSYWWGDWKIIHLLVVGLILNAIFAYGLIYYLVPKFLDAKRYVLFGILSLVWFYLICAIHSASYFYYFEHIYEVFMWVEKSTSVSMYRRLTNVAFMLTIFSTFIGPAIILGAIKFYKKQMTLSKIEEEKNSMELRALKNQLNPHFLFNTLNNLYSFVVNGSPKAPDMILKLSGILDYVLYKSQQAEVALSEEIETIENFIALERIRYGDRLQVDCKVEGNMDVNISPLILLSIVENAFKHGASGDINEAEIKIDIKEANQSISCNVWNTKSGSKGEVNDEYKQGIGLSNIKRQLHLLYPNKHNLIIEDKIDSFNLLLQLKAEI